ncbi:MAG: hypothetical protein U0S12_10260 [Fimbriimonadales bacterium]
MVSSTLHRALHVIGIGSAVALVAVATSTRASSAGQSGSLVRLQPTTPGTAQSGHVNVDGTVHAGTFESDFVYTSEVFANRFYGDGVGIYGFTLEGLDTTGAGVGQVPVFDGARVVWGDVSGGGTLSLPFSGSADTSGGAASIENLATTSGSSGVAAYGNGNGSGLYAVNRNTGGGGYAIKALHNGAGTAVYAESVGGAAIAGGNLTSGNFASLGTINNGIFAMSSSGSSIFSQAFGNVGFGLEAYASGPAYAAVLGQHSVSNNYGELGMADFGVYGSTATNVGVFGYASSGTGVVGVNSASGTRGTLGEPNYGVYGSSNGTSGVFGVSNSSRGVYGKSLGAADGVFGENTSTGAGVHGKGNVGVLGEAAAGYAVYGYSSSTLNSAAIYGESAGYGGTGVKGYSPYRGVEGTTVNGSGVFGRATSSNGLIAYGVEGKSDSTDGTGGLFVCYGARGAGVRGYGDSSGAYPQATGVFGQANVGVRGSGSYGVVSNGLLTASPSPGSNLACFINGDLTVSGNKSFAIDYPLDPAHYELRHYCTEGAEPLNAYSGTVETDAKGYAWVKLPDYFESINKDFRYQLTVVDESGGDFVQVRVSQKIQDNQFQIQTSRGRIEVSWRVEATRNDRYNQMNPPQDVLPKKGNRVGKYLDPETWGRPATEGMHYLPPVDKPKGR